jgi:hypothetical protein
MIEIEVFPAAYGDALLVSWGRPDAPTRMLVDAGLTGVARTVERRLAELDATIDLFVITHIDVDHIAGAVRLLDTPSFAARVQQVWFNGKVHLDQYDDLLGARDGERVSTRLRALGIGWNTRFAWRRDPGPGWHGVGGPVVADEPTEIPLPGDAVATLLSPSGRKLAALIPDWNEVIRDAGVGTAERARREAADPPERLMLGGPTLRELADEPTDDDDRPANGSSIAFVLDLPVDPDAPTSARRRVLLAGDAHPDLLTEALRALANAEGRCRLDVCKLPHHGSARNVTRSLVQTIDCPTWIVSTSGKLYGHPSLPALARILVDGGAAPTFVSNYPANPSVDRFVAAYPATPTRRYDIVRPTNDGASIRLRL